MNKKCVINTTPYTLRESASAHLLAIWLLGSMKIGKAKGTSRNNCLMYARKSMQISVMILFITSLWTILSIYVHIRSNMFSYQNEIYTEWNDAVLFVNSMTHQYKLLSQYYNISICGISAKLWCLTQMKRKLRFSYRFFYSINIW